MLAAYRELKHGQTDTTELDVHLEQCSACRGVLAQQSFVGERVRQLPSVEPAPDAHAKLMQALAIEHSRFLQQSPSSHAVSTSSVPDFLKPYLKEPVQPTHSTSNTLAAFSTAETGPLPIIKRKQRLRVSPVGQFAVLGLAAAFLMVFLVGGMVSLLLLANHGLSGTNTTITSVQQPSQVALARYSPETSYPNVMSAVANHNHIYYSAYGNRTKQWMIEQVDGTRTGSISIPLLPKESTNSLFVLGASQDWLTWLQFDVPKALTQHKSQKGDVPQTRTWSLYALFLGEQQTTTHSFGEPVLLRSGTFNPSTAPSWVHTPVQGLSFEQQDVLLVTVVDEKGNSQFLSYRLLSQQRVTVTTIATASAGHILTSPTATSDGMSIYWDEEWLTNNSLHGNVWMQQTSTVDKRQHGRWSPNEVNEKSLFRSDGMSFHPQVVNDTLFLLSTSDAATTAQGTPGATSTPTQHTMTQTPTSTSVPTTPVISRVDPASHTTQIDEGLRGTIYAFPLNDLSAQPAVLSDNGAAPQGGSRFLLWQSDKGYAMYDTVANSPVNIDTITISKDTPFLAVNGEMVVWIAGTGNTPDTGVTNSKVTFNFFNWPKG